MINIPIADIREYCRVGRTVTDHDVPLTYAYNAAIAEAEKEFNLDPDEDTPDNVIMFVLKRTYRHFEHRVDGVTSESIQGVGSVTLSEDSKIKRGKMVFV